MDDQKENRVWPSGCRHVEAGTQRGIERLEMTLRLTTVEPHDDDYRYVKGPDVVTLCAFCAGKMLGTFMKECMA